ncbi:double-strand break repair helicase AddA [Sphingorhabdus sp. EL138]|uniref:double-strand break repair helicase AddA n=1 Tax=Sphingorhabdus sp. EL138 TaxID=2073156 RepID=UPI0025FFC4BB|nr:double-strand break repair helicase AddA [Sphingorhabdus sp. EL138]
MSAEPKKLHPLIPAQSDAVMPRDNIWLSASAGTGKTQVLTARVIRLLLENDVEPENLLCITFTKAGASEMADRINQLLATWVQMDGTALGEDLKAIGADYSPDARKKARQLFAKVLDAPGGGLQILTIHSFCQSLLGSFPQEAGLVPGFKPIEGREQRELLDAALANLVLDAEARGDDRIIANLQELSLNMGEEAALRFLHRTAAAPDVMASIPDDAGAVVWARRLADVSFSGSVEDNLEEAFADAHIPRADLQSIIDANLLWCGNKADSRGGKRAAVLQNWLSCSPAERAASFAELHSCWSTKDGEMQNSSRNFTPMSDAYAAQALEMFQWTNQLVGQAARAQYADRLARALLVGKEFAAQYSKAKHALGAVDFDDLIRRTAALLQHGQMADWVRFKLDRQIDHILVDEAQDTNAAQWDIISALSDDFYSGMGVKPDRIRTLFSVGDFKQAIYGFQGTAPERYEAAGADFAKRIGDAGSELNQLTLSQSFRSTPPILDFVNAVIEEAGPESFGIKGEIAAHYGDKPHVGMVELLEPISAKPNGQNDSVSDDEEDWFSDEKRALAERLADHVKALIDAKPWLVSKDRPLEPGDIMFLLRSRGDMASMLVAQLHERNVPVAGIDRLRLLQPLVVQDLLAAIKFVLQPNDDFSLACLLVSPIIGWSQETLLQYGYVGDRKGSLWQHIRDRPELAQQIAPLRDMLAMADFTTVYHFLEQILSGPIAARRKFTARLGNEVLVPIEEMLNSALQFEQQHSGGLQKFIAWFDRGDAEIKREGDSSSSKDVRIMTVHGAKGLQAPVVILADITSDPTKKPDQSVELLMDEGHRTPLLPIRKAEQSGRLLDIIDMQKTRELQEHKRLLYVAITRAEERLIMAGSLGISRKGVPPVESWYALVQRGMVALGCDWEDDARWGRVMRHVGRQGASLASPEGSINTTALTEPLVAAPHWLFAPAPAEQRPPRPLVPSRLDDDDYGDAPAPSAMRKAAARGKLIHALLERITDNVSLQKAEQYLAAQTPDNDIDQADLIAEVRGIVNNPQWAPFFGLSARAEVPLVAVVGEMVINGRIDRLLVEPGLVRAIDFKTGRQVPQDERGVPVPHLRQMAHYRAALQTIFPASRIEVSLLFTHAPHFITLSDAMLAPYYPAS